MTKQTQNLKNIAEKSKLKQPKSKVVNFAVIKENLTKKYIKHPYVKKLGMTEKDVRNHIVDLNRVIISNQKCNINDNQPCPLNGYHYELEKKDDDYVIVNVPCKKTVERNFIKNYYFRDFDNALLKNRMNADYIDNYDSSNRGDLALLMKQIKKNENNRGFYLHGSFGIGKTYLMVCLANELAHLNRSVAFIMMGSFVLKIKQSFDRSGELSQIDYIEKLKTVNVLFIDEMGTETVGQWVHNEFLFSILNYRLQHDLLTIFISNLSITELTKYYQTARSNNNSKKLSATTVARLMNRIQSLSYYNYIELKGPDVRQRNIKRQIAKKVKPK